MKFVEFNYYRPDLTIMKAEIYNYIETINKGTSSESVIQAVQEIQSIQNTIDSQSSIAYIRYSINTKDSFYEKEVEFWDEYNPLIEDWVTDYYKAVLNTPFLGELKEELPATFFKIIEQKLKVFDTEIIPLLQKENKLETKYEKLVASASLEYKGNDYNISEIQPFTQSTDRLERKVTSELISSFFAEHQTEFDELYDELVHTRHQMAQILGYKDFVEMGYDRMNRLDYTREDVEVFRQEVKQQIVPLADEIYQRQKERLELDKLTYYDLNLNFPTGNPKPIGTHEEIIEKAYTMYREMSPETEEFFDFMLKHGLMDLLAQAGKQSGGYCTYIPNYNAPFIFANFNGTSADVDVLTHEAGHAFQVYQSRWIDTPEVLWPTYESSEIHSMSMEFIAWPWMELFFGDQTEKYKYSHLASAAAFLPYGVLVDHFQHKIYENPNLTPEERRAQWRELEEYYTPWKDYADNAFYLNGGRWFMQGHIFTDPFYYIDYTLAQVCALQFWVRSQIEQDDRYWSDYLEICRIGGTQSFQEIIKSANLASPFEKGNLAAASEAIRSFLNTIEETQLK